MVKKIDFEQNIHYLNNNTFKKYDKHLINNC